jgi:polyribonucleotide nucleotidyltransferase
MSSTVPVKRLVAGVAMGLILDEDAVGEPEAPIILTDILGLEDGLGTMDLKVAGDREGISAFQLDIKCEGLSISTLRTALEASLHVPVHRAQTPFNNQS